MSYFSPDYHRGFVLQQLGYEYNIKELMTLARNIWDEHTARNAVTMAGHIPLADVPSYYCRDIKDYNGDDRREIIRVYQIAKGRYSKKDQHEKNN